jgi:hypothetical protein
MGSQTAERELIEAILVEYTRVPYAHGEVGFETVFDREQDRYLLMLVGFEGDKRVHGCLTHVDIVDGKFWIQRDGTEYGVARELLDRGVPRDRIVLAFQSPEVRQFGEFAVA